METLGHQGGQPADVILVYVGHENGSDVLRAKGKSNLLTRLQRILGIAVERAAVDQVAGGSRLE
jgi:hypothetical protein